MKKRYRLLVLLLIVAMLFAGIPHIPSDVYAASKGTSSTKGVYWFDTHELGEDLTDTYVYDEELLKGDSLEYNQQLATMSFELAVASISSEREPKTAEGYANKSRNLRAYLEDNGFVDFDTNKYYKEKMTTTTMGAACAHKKITDNGKEYTLLAIVPRSAGYEAEWGGNFMIGDSGDSQGFKNGKNIVLEFARSYIEDKGITGDIKVWTAGYSRGAGVTNQVGAALAADPVGSLGTNVTLTPDNLYCYTFGTPKSANSPIADYGDPSSDTFQYVHNTYELYDIVTVAPTEGFGFTRYGTHTSYADRGDKTRMLEMLKYTNPLVYDLYMNGGDPDGFSPKTINIRKLFNEGTFEITDDNDSYLPDKQADFMKLMEDSITEAVSKTKNAEGSAREIYYEKYQDAMEHLCGYYFSHTEDGGKLIEGIKGSKYTIPLVGFMYISYMLERNLEVIANSDASLDEINKAMAEIDEVITQAGGADAAPEDLMEQYIELKRKLGELDNAEAKIAKWRDISDIADTIRDLLYSEVMRAGLTNAGADADTITMLTSSSESKAISRILSYMLLYDTRQTDVLISFTTVTQQMKHFATFIGNASSYMRPHNNEIILSWLRTLDSNYDDYAKEDEAQKAGYRRCYISRPEGVDVSGTVRDGSGNVVAKFKNGEITSRTDSWIGITTSDEGNWLRLPVDKTYRIEISACKDANLSLRVAEWSVYDGEEVREVTSDKKYNWTGLKIKKEEKVTWVISAVSADYALPSSAYYYIEKTQDATTPQVSVTPLMAKAVAKGKNSVALSWNKVDGADRYVVYMAKCNNAVKDYKLKKVKTLPAAKTKWTKTGLKKNAIYKFKVVAKKKVKGSYVNVDRSKSCHIITGNVRGRYTNPKILTLTQSKISLSAGKTALIKGSVSKCAMGKKLLVKHVSKLRFRSDNTAVATVNSKGVVTAVAAGSCKIYVQTINGIWKTVKVTVK